MPKDNAPRYSRGLHYLAIITAIATFPLIFLGGLVTSHDAGLTVPNWPNSFEYNMLTFPVSRWTGGIFYEHTHRLLGTLVGILTVVLVAMAWKYETRRWVRNLAMAVLGAVIIQGVLGGLRVILVNIDLAIVHACVAQAFFCLALLVAMVTSRAWSAVDTNNQVRLSVDRTLVLLTAIAITVVYLQLIAGAVMRHNHAGLAIPDFPLSYGKILPPANAVELGQANEWRARLPDAYGHAGIGYPVTLSQIWIHFIHRIGAVVTVVVLLSLVARILAKHSHNGRFLRPAMWLLALLATQCTLGILTVLQRKPADLATGHVVLGALILAITFILAVRCLRPAMPLGDDASGRSFDIMGAGPIPQT